MEYLAFPSLNIHLSAAFIILKQKGNCVIKFMSFNFYLTFQKNKRMLMRAS
jgi:hypothetical protein